MLRRLISSAAEELSSMHDTRSHTTTHWEPEPSDVTALDCGVGSITTEIPGLAANLTTTSTGMRDETLLLSWLMVLLRTREGSQITYDWTYAARERDLGAITRSRCLSLDRVVSGLDTTVRQATAAIAHEITTVSPGDMVAADRSEVVLLSTSSLSRGPEEGSDEVSRLSLSYLR